MKTKLFLICAFALIALVACAAPAPTATPVPPTPVPTPDPAAQIKALVDVLNAGNVDSAIAFFIDDATQTQTPPPSGTTGTRTGKEQIRGFYKGLIDDHFNVELSNVKVTGDKVTYTCTFSTDSYKKMGVAPLITLEEAVFVGGKIKSQTINVSPESLAKIQAAMAAAQAKPPAIASPVEFVSSITGGADATLSTPVGIAVDKQGNLYVMDSGHARVVKFDSAGKMVTTWGTQGAGDGQFVINPYAVFLAVDGQGNVYVADGANRIQKFDSNGKFILKWGSKGEGQGQFLTDQNLAVDSKGNVYVTERGNRRVEKFDSNGKYLATLGGEIYDPVGLSIDRDDNVYVAEFRNGQIHKFDSAGKLLNKFFIPQVADKFVSPSAVAVDSQGNLYITDRTNARLVKLDTAGNPLGVLGKAGGGGGDGEFRTPLGVVIDANGNIYVSDSQNSRIQKFKPK